MAFASAALERGGCVIGGAAGVGKSRLAAEVAVQHRGPVVRVVATAAAASIPFGAFAHLLAGMASGPQGAIAACIAALRQHSPGRPPTLLVDDIHLLDEASAALVLAVCESETAPVMATVRRGQRVPDAITALWKEGWLERLDLQPLSRRELRALVEACLGGAADANVHTTTFSLTEGNPLYARELLIDATRSRALAEHDGCWCWTGRPPEITRLRDLIEPRTRALTPLARVALELLAVSPSLRFDELTSLTGDDAVAEVERAGLATVRGGTEAPLVDLAHPVFGEVVLAGMPAATARGHRRRLADVIAGSSSGGSFDLLRVASLKLESGEADPELFLRAAAFALCLQAGVPGPGWEGDAGLAVRLADAVGPGLEAALLGAQGRMAICRFAEAAEQLAALEDVAAQAGLEPAVAYLRTRVNALHWSGRTEDALALVERAQWRGEPDWAVLRATLKGWILHDRGEPAAALAALRPIAHADGLAPPVRLDALVLHALLLSRLGQLDRCEALEPQIEQVVDDLERSGAQTGWARHVVDGLGRAEAARDLRTTAGRLRSARERAEAGGAPALAAALAMVLGRLELTRGHARDAIALLEDAAAGLTTGDPRNGLGWTLAWLARAHALCGDLSAAEAALAQAESVAAERPGRVIVLHEIERAGAWMNTVEGRISTARKRLLEVADAAGEGLAAEAEAVYDALRFGAPPQECAQRLSALAASTRSDLVGAGAQHAVALATGDAAAQLQAAERFAELELDLFAAEAAAGAARAFAGDGRQSATRRAAALMGRHLALCGQVTTPALASPPAAERLTPREREVALLAARGHTNAEIADDLVLSIRSVETYVLRACRKLGIARRTSLSKALGVNGGE